MIKNKASLIIRTKNEERWIKPCLDKIFQQDYKNHEVIIVDNKSTDNTLKIVKDFNVKIVNFDEEFFPGKALNKGIRNSNGEYIVCLSGHCIPKENNWLSKLVSNLKDKKVAGVYGRQEPLPYSSDSNKRDLWTVFGLDKKIQKKDTFFHNANSILRRKVWNKFPFDEDITNIEDRIWGKEVINSGFKIIYEPAASVYHFHGIHQDSNPIRLKNVVKIVESLDLINEKKSLSANKNQTVAIIPFKGKENLIKDFSFLKKTILDAKSSKLISKVVVSCDDEETVNISKKYGADFSFLRSKHLSSAFLGVNSVLKEALNFVDPLGKKYGKVVFLSSTYPFRNIKTLDQMIREFDKQKVDSLIPAIKETNSILQQNDDSEFEFLDEGFIPKHIKKPLFKAKNGFGLVTRPQFVSEDKVVGSNFQVYEIENFLEAQEISDQTTLDIFKDRLG